MKCHGSMMAARGGGRWERMVGKMDIVICRRGVVVVVVVVVEVSGIP
jgi:hypothetical protein